MRVLAAMSGGVDSAVAATRAAEQGHDVTGIHLALSRNPKSYRTGARGCCTVEDIRAKGLNHFCRIRDVGERAIEEMATLVGQWPDVPKVELTGRGGTP